MKFCVATYNIHKGVSSFGSRPRVHALKQALHKMEADILFLQEVQGRHDLHAVRHAAHWPAQAQHDFLAGDSHHCAYGCNAIYDHGHHGNALLSSFPILSSRNQDVSAHVFEQRGILHCVVQAPTVEVHCYVVHLGLFASGRKRQNEALIQAVRHSAPEAAPVIIAGDFNDWNDSLGESLRAELGVREVFDQAALEGDKPKPARTFPAMMPWLRLDRIYVRGFAVESARVFHGPSWAQLSDHAPIVATVQLDR